MLLRDGLVAWIGTDSAPPAARVLEASGKFLMPALFDMHVHAWGNPSPLPGPDQACGVAQTARLMLYCGVVGFLDLGSDEATIFSFRDRQRRTGAPGADLYAAGAVIGHLVASHRAKAPAIARDQLATKRFRAAQNAQQARRHVRALKALRADVVKIMYDHTGQGMNMPRAVLTALVREAHRLDMKVVVHIGNWQDAADAVAEGVDAITHLWDEDDIPVSLVKKWARRGVRSIPTQPVQVDLPNVLARPGLLAHPLLRAVTTPQLRADYRKVDRFVPKAQFWRRYQGPNARHYERQLRRLHAGNVPLMAGSDSGNFGVFQGFSLHREIALLHRAGVPTWGALRAATIEPGRFLGRKIGVAIGDEASLLLLNADPRVSINNTTDIAEVIQRGAVVDRAALLRGTSADPTLRPRSAVAPVQDAVSREKR